MTVSKYDLLEVLPPFLNDSIIIEKKQDIHDIIKEVLEAHRFFSNDYDYIFQFFDAGSIKQICENLFNFCKSNIDYKIESEDQQTTKSPAAILATGEGDCKHYAGFIGGVLSAINRNERRGINWRYTFASYSIFDEDVQHVFITVIDGNNEYWIDPVLKYFNSRAQMPVFKIDKKVKDEIMLTRVSGIETRVGVVQPLSVMDYGSTYLKMNAVTQAVDIPTDLDDIETNLSSEMLDNIKMLLYYGIIDTNNNIFYDVYVNTLASLADDSDKAALSNAFGAFTDTINSASVGDIFGDIWNSVKQVGLAPARGAYLALVSLNVFGLASKMYELITNSDGSKYQPGIDRLEETWHKKLMGDTNLLLRAIGNGHAKKAIFGIGANTVPSTGSGVALSAAAAAIPGVGAWVAVAIGIITALAPVILAALKAKQAAGYSISPASLNTGYVASTSSTLTQYLPYILIGGVALYFLMDKKRK